MWVGKSAEPQPANLMHTVHGVSIEPNTKFRKSMEDAHTVHTIGQFQYYAVFDGHAGAVCAKQSAARLHIILEQTLRETEDVALALFKSFNQMDLEFKDISNSGSTACVAVLKGADLVVANVGDTRAVLCRAGKALRLSYDHKGSDKHERARISNAGGLLINNRVNGVLAVTRALGDLYMKDYVVGDPYTTRTKLEQGDDYLILACDGIWDVFSDQQAADIVRGKAPQEAADNLVRAALENGSMDNLTAIVVPLAIK